MCQMILQKVAIPVGVNGKSYWESMMLGLTNKKFCALWANFEQELFEQFQGKFSRINICIVADSNNQYLFALDFYVDNKEVGWILPSDNGGRIYVTVKRLTTDGLYSWELPFVRLLLPCYVSSLPYNKCNILFLLIL